MLDEILQRLNSLPEEEQKEIIDAAIEETKDMVFVPNPGPQTDAYFSEADELFYGGQAGGGKSALIVGLSMVAHTKSLILRRINKDAKKLAKEELINNLLDGDSNGWNGTDLTYSADGKVIDFGGCEMEENKQRYKGDPHDLICVASGTNVVMGDGLLKPVESIAVGDMVMTLEGPKRLKNILPVASKECVSVTAIDEKGVIVAKQTQSANHPILTPTGWSSAAGLGEPYGPTLPQRICSFSGLSVPTFLKKLKHLSMKVYCSQRKDESYLSSLGCQLGLETHAFDQQLAQGIYCGEYCDRNGETQQLALLSGHLEHLKPSLKSGEPSASLLYLWHEESDALEQSSPSGLMGRCWSYIRRHGEHALQAMDLLISPRVDQQCLLLLGGAEIPTPNHSLDGGQDETQKHSLRQIRKYAHPYTKEIRQVAGSGSLHPFSLVISPAEVCNVYDLEVEEVNHYITEGGFVNQNCFDEITDFLKTQYEFITIWNRSTKPGQRCRVVCTGNPPTTAEGLWVIQHWGAWLDPKHPNPAKPGELRWYLRDEIGEEIEVDGEGPHRIDGKDVYAKSRTFIPAKLSDNPDLADDGEYERILDALPKELRDAYRDGRFDSGLKDNPWQLIPTSWVIAAQERWQEKPPEGTPMCAIGVDVAQGGDDDNIIAPRHDWWYDELQVIPGKETPLGTDVAGVVVARRRDNADVVIDCGGGYGGSAFKHCKENGIPVYAYKGSEGTTKKTKDGSIGFTNTRTCAYWMFREALDPGQAGGAQIALPPDSILLSDLTAPFYETKGGKFAMETKKDLTKRLGRSPDRGDAVIMAWYKGTKGANIQGGWKQSAANRKPSVVMGRGRHSVTRGRGR